MTLTITVDDGGLSDLGKTLNATRSLTDLQNTPTDIAVTATLDRSDFDRNWQNLQQQIASPLVAKIEIDTTALDSVGDRSIFQLLRTNFNNFDCLHEVPITRVNYANKVVTALACDCHPS